MYYTILQYHETTDRINYRTNNKYNERTLMIAQLSFSAASSMLDKLCLTFIYISNKLAEEDHHVLTRFSFTGWFSIKGAQADGKGLEGREWITVIHGKHVFSNLSKLQDHLFLLRGRNIV